jgi:hypothetical protein
MRLDGRVADRTALSICSRDASRAKIALQVIRRERAMAVAALKHKLKTFHATLHVTRVEEWYVEAESLEQARDLLAAGAGYRCQIGDCLNLEIERLEE